MNYIKGWCRFGSCRYTCQI